MQVDPASRQIVTVLALKLTHSLWDRWSRHKNDYTLSKRHQTSFEPLIKSVWKLQRKRKTGTVQLYPASNILHLSSLRYPFILKFLWCVCVTFSVFKHSNSASTGQVMAKHDKNIDFLRLGASHPKWLLFWWTLEDNGCQRDLVFDRINPHVSDNNHVPHSKSHLLT